MNYFAHGCRFVADPLFLTGTAVPDWLNVVDRKMKVRSKHAAPFVDHEQRETAAIARGIVQHHHDDDWFHRTTAFVSLSADFTQRFRGLLPLDEGFRPWFLGHITVELLLDAVLIEESPARLDDYYAALMQPVPEVVEASVNRMATKSTERLRSLVPLFVRERFLYDYLDDGKLLARLNGVMRRVGLPSLPEPVTTLFAEMRTLVRRERPALLHGWRDELGS